MQIEDTCCDYKLKEKCAPNVREEDKFPKDVLKTIHDIAKKEGFTKYHVSKKSISTHGGNYLGVLFEVDIKEITADEEKELNLFVKCTTDGDHHKIVSVSQAYMKECFTYNELFEIFKKLQEDANVPKEERLKMAKKYSASLDAIILENLTKRGFTTYHRMEVIPLAFAKLAVVQLAKIHGLFYVLERKLPDYFENLKSFRQVFICNEEWEAFMINNSKTSASGLQGELKKKIDEYIPKVVGFYRKYAVETNGSYMTICHGDYKLNNILVKETNGEATEVIPVDYQIMYYGSPINDFMYFIYTSTDREFRKKYLETLKNLYHNSLTTFLGYFSLNINDIFPRKEFDRLYQERFDYVLMMTLYGTPFFFTDENNAPDIANDDLTKINFVLDPRGHQRVKEIVEEFVEMGYL